MSVKPTNSAHVPEPEVDLAIEACGGEARAAVRELFADADFLRDQLYTASMVMSAGYAGGWRPRYERP